MHVCLCASTGLGLLLLPISLCLLAPLFLLGALVDAWSPTLELSGFSKELAVLLAQGRWPQRSGVEHNIGGWDLCANMCECAYFL